MISFHGDGDFRNKFLPVGLLLGDGFSFDHFGCPLKTSIFHFNFRNSSETPLSDLLYVDVVLQVVFLLDLDERRPVDRDLNSIYLFAGCQFVHHLLQAFTVLFTRDIQLIFLCAFKVV